MLSMEGSPKNGAASLFDGDGTFGFDPAVAVRHLRASDEKLGRLIDLVGPFRMGLRATPNVFLALAEAIVYQQLSGKAAATIFGRVRALFPRAHEGPTADQILRASDEKLRGAGLSRSKLLSLRDLAEKAKKGEIPTLAEIPSNGRRSDRRAAHRRPRHRSLDRGDAALFRLGRPDVLPVDDYGVQKGFAVAYKKRKLPERSALEKHGMKRKPYRTVASWYLWRATELGKK